MVRGADRWPSERYASDRDLGPGDRLNLVPMNGNLNTGAWKEKKNQLADALEAGKQVDLRIYAAIDNARPAKFAVTETIDGVEILRSFRDRS